MNISRNTYNLLFRNINYQKYLWQQFKYCASHSYIWLWSQCWTKHWQHRNTAWMTSRSPDYMKHITACGGKCEVLGLINSFRSFHHMKFLYIIYQRKADTPIPLVCSKFFYHWQFHQHVNSDMCCDIHICKSPCFFEFLGASRFWFCWFILCVWVLPYLSSSDGIIAAHHASVSCWLGELVTICAFPSWNSWWNLDWIM